ncbi:hypothetical protein ACFQBQ_03730 [Granulicella cerasi]|uniref:Uncharacterized protein n=1 Tax=Granulicella cerasi TaxID=741063 RepID=A0ABW1Z6X3_9BACT|nr:hypothetical protein [Granulicella cerasi]
MQALDEATLTLQGVPLTVAHSPQKIVLSNNIAYVTLYDAGQIISIDATVLSSLRSLQTFSLPSCAAIPVQVVGTSVFVGCYAQGTILQLDASAPQAMTVKSTFNNIPGPESFAMINGYMIIVGGYTGASVFTMNVGGATGISGRV